MQQIDEKLIENELWDEDIELFQKVDGHYFSENERVFFETLYLKMLTEYAPCSELLLSEMDNPDQIYLLRTEYDEFIVGMGEWKKNRRPEVHTMTLVEALNVNLKEHDYYPESITLWDWLRRNDYSGIMYDHNYLYL